MARSKSSGQWLKEHFSDAYVKQAQKDGYRSRAAYKLLEINERDSILKPGTTVVDLGAAPGGWTQVVSNVLNGQGRIIATDILPMDSLPDVDIVQGDFREQDTLEQLLKCVGDAQVGLVISDMAPNITGVAAIDQPRAMYLSELVVDFLNHIPFKNGHLLIKVFQGSGFDELLQDLRKKFQKVVIRKPKSSRPRSREVYLLAKSYKNNF